MTGAVRDYWGEVGRELGAPYTQQAYNAEDEVQQMHIVEHARRALDPNPPHTRSAPARQNNAAAPREMASSRRPEEWFQRYSV